jgi:hypothetical protein
VKVPTTEKQPATVEWAGKTPAFPKQAGEAQAPWVWVERSVWTERRLNRLGQSQEQTVWFSLWDKVWNSDNLSQAMLEVIVKAGSAGGTDKAPNKSVKTGRGSRNGCKPNCATAGIVHNLLAAYGCLNRAATSRVR